MNNKELNEGKTYFGFQVTSQKELPEYCSEYDKIIEQARKVSGGNKK